MKKDPMAGLGGLGGLGIVQASGTISKAGRTMVSAVALLLVSLPLGGCNKFEAKQLIRAGNANFKAEQYEAALKKYEEAQALDPDEVRLLKFIAMANMALYTPGSQHPKDIEALTKAIENFKKYLAAKPEDEKAAKFLVTTYMNGQKYDEAIGYFKEFIQGHPNDSQALQTIAMLYAKKGDFDNSMEWQKKHGEKEPRNADIFYTMGVTCWDKAYNTVGTDVDPEKGLSPEKRKEIVDLGMQSIDKALAIKPDYFQAMLYKNLLFREMAKAEPDPALKQAHIDQANEWQKKALEIRKKVLQKEREDQAAKNPLEAL